MVQPYSSTGMGTTWKNSRFILSERSYFDFNHILIAIHALPVAWRKGFVFFRLVILKLWSTDNILVYAVANLK